MAKQSRALIHKTNIRSLLSNPASIIFIVCLAILAFSIIYIGRLRPFNSDDLYWQQVVKTWRPFSGETFYFGTKDIFVILAPFFAVTEWLFSPSRRLLILETVFLTLSSFTMFYFASLYFLRKLQVRPTYVTLLPFVWLSSFGYPLVQNYLNTDWRTFQTGFSFATFALVAAICNRDFKPLGSSWSKTLSVLAILATGVLTYGDPYYTFFTIIPLILFSGALFLLKKIDQRQLLMIYGGIGLGLLVGRLLAELCAKAGIHIVMSTPSIFVGFDQIVDNAIASLHGMLIVFGADFFGRQVASIVTLGFILNAALLGIVLHQVFKKRKLASQDGASQTDLPLLWAGFLAGTMAFIFLVYTSSSLAAVSNYRFYISFVYCGVALLAIGVGLTKNQKQRLFVAALLLAATVFNLTYTVVEAKNTPGDIAVNRQNWRNFALIDAVAAEGLTKGYASYWHGNVNTYLSDNQVTFLPSICSPDGLTSQFKWLIDGGQFDRKASSSFYMIDPQTPAPPTCTRQQLEAQFGLPKKTLQVADETILVWDYDITSKMR